MKTVQEWLHKTDIERIIGSYLVEYPIDFPMLHNKNVTVEKVFDAVKENLRGLIQYLLSLEVAPAEAGVFYAVHARGEQYREVKAVLSFRKELLVDELPESYAWDFTPWEQILGYRIADTKLTLDHMDTVLAEILYEMTFFGSDHEGWKERVAEVEDSLRVSLEEAKAGDYRSAEEVFAELGLPRDEPDEITDELNRNITLAEIEYNQHCRRREAAKVRKLLLGE